MSTAEQARGGTLQSQIERVQGTGVDLVLSDLQSGRSTARPGYRRLLELVEGGRATAVIATRWDRICRSATETCRWVDLLAADGAPQLELLDDPLAEAGTVVGRFTLRLFGSLAEMEAERIRERGMAGKLQRKQRGAADKAPFGLRLTSSGGLEPDDSLWATTLSDQHEWTRSEAALALWERLEAEGAHFAWRWMQNRFGKGLDRSGILRWGLNPALRGARVRGRSKAASQDLWGEVTEGVDPALIDPDRHRALEQHYRLKRAKGHRTDVRRQHPLTGLLICGHCNRRLTRRKVTRGTPRYQCPNPSCGWYVQGKRINSISEQAAMDAVVDALLPQADRIVAIIEGYLQNTTTSNELEALQSRRVAYQARLDVEPELESAIKALDLRISNLLAAASAGTGESDELRVFREDLTAFVQLWMRVTGEVIGVPTGPEDIARDIQQIHNAQTFMGKALVAYLQLGGMRWLTPEHRDTGCLWLDRWVRRVTVTAKNVEQVDLAL
ncbi:recombinase family protein [Synechococcus sp. CBW1107]|uniref:recombinase family protein n=1 Tax=Synechococcus sp. CBW1107 TaxID=2789857 RepID=UPI002AD535EB|nr:recombinase family protein [Synechococcus sp. CBW1107]